MEFQCFFFFTRRLSDAAYSVMPIVVEHIILYAQSLSGQVLAIGWAENPTHRYIHNVRRRRLPLGAADRTLKTIIIFIFILLLVIDRPLAQYNITLPTCMYEIYYNIYIYIILCGYKHIPNI